MVKKYTALFLLLGLIGWSSQQVAAQTSSPTTYTVTFAATWSEATHPADFPRNPHFSPLVGATHNSEVVFWELGQIASAGMEQMAETGLTGSLRNEVETALQNGYVGSFLLDRGLSPSPGALSFTFEITPEYPRITLVSMIAPSPDWFVGVSGLDLLENGQWRDRVEVELFAYDAGTDSGAGYTAQNADTDPAEAITRIEAAPFVVNDNLTSVGTFTFVRDGATTVEGRGAVRGTHHLSTAYPNPFRQRATFTLAVRERQQVRIAVYNLLGQRVATLYEGLMTAGIPHRFSLESNDLPDGVYLYRAEGERFSESRRVILLR